MIKAVIVDLDDTLCLTEAACFEMENEVLKRMGRAPMSHEIHIKTWGRSVMDDAIAERSPGIDISEFKKAYGPVIKEFTDTGRLDSIPGENLRALDEITQSGKKLMLLTSRTRPEMLHLLEPGHELSTRIAGYYHKDNTRHHKPDPRAFDELLRDFALRPDECVYVGDSKIDAVASTSAGIGFIASLESGLRSKKDFADFMVIAHIKRFPELVDVLRNLS